MREIALLKVNPKNMPRSLQSTKKIVSYTIIYNSHIQISCTNAPTFRMKDSHQYVRPREASEALLRIRKWNKGGGRKEKGSCYFISISTLYIPHRQLELSLKLCFCTIVCAQTLNP